MSAADATPFPSIEEMFAAAGASYRAVQRDYAEAVSKGIRCAKQNKEGMIMIEAETGVGKTLGYLLPAMRHAVRHNERIIVSTYTKALQRQIMGVDIPNAMRSVETTMGRRLIAARLVGRQNFFDEDRVKEVIASIEAEVQDGRQSAEAAAANLEAWKDVLMWIAAPETSGEIVDYIEENGPLPGNAPAETVNLTHQSTSKSLENYRHFADLAREADVLVCNHAILAISANNNVRVIHEDNDERRIGAVIIDEADRMPDAARGLFNFRLPLVRLKRVIEEWAVEQSILSEDEVDILRQHVSNLDTALKAVQGLSVEGDDVEIFDALGKEDQTAIINALTQMAFFVKLVNKVLTTKKISIPHDSAIGEILRYGKVAEKIAMSMVDKEYRSTNVPVVEFSPSRKYPALALIDIYPARRLRTLWKYVQEGLEGDEKGEENDKKNERLITAVILTSATLSGSDGADDPFVDMKIQFGLDDRANPCSHLHAKFAPKHYGNIKEIVYPDQSVHKPFDDGDTDIDRDIDRENVRINEEWAAYAASMVAAAAREGGRVLALTTSYRTASVIGSQAVLAGLRCIQKTRTLSMDTAITDLLSTPDCVLITPTGWEGLDANSFGFHWDHVVICQLPFPYVDTARSEAILHHLMRLGKSETESKGIVFGNSMSAAFRRLKQGIGRGIRTSEDEFKLWIADPRFPLPKDVLNDEDMYCPAPAGRIITMLGKAIPHRFRNSAKSSLLLKKGATG